MFVDKGAYPIRVAEIPAQAVGAKQRAAAELALEKAGRDMPGVRPRVRWFLPAEDGYARDLCRMFPEGNVGYKTFVLESTTRGATNQGEDAVWVSARQDPDATLETVLHECAHVKQYRTPDRPWDADSMEKDARAYETKAIRDLWKELGG